MNHSFQGCLQLPLQCPRFENGLFAPPVNALLLFPILSLKFGLYWKMMCLNSSAHTDPQHQIAASRHVLRAGGLQR